jgi:hypothetical protein
MAKNTASGPKEGIGKLFRISKYRNFIEASKSRVGNKKPTQKNPLKKTQKNPPKKPLKMFFF